MASSSRAIAPLLFLVVGCAHMAATPPERGRESDGAAGPPPAAPPAAEPMSPTAPPARGEAPALDSSEVMTPEELATIPDPLPGGGAGTPAPAVSSARDGASEPRSETSGGSAPGASVWRVQILATPDRALADRVAAEAVDRLGTTSTIDLEGSLYKVRLGRFATEGEAQSLRERAIEMGYPGAFRVKSAPP